MISQAHPQVNGRGNGKRQFHRRLGRGAERVVVTIKGRADRGGRGVCPVASAHVRAGLSRASSPAGMDAAGQAC